MRLSANISVSSMTNYVLRVTGLRRANGFCGRRERMGRRLSKPTRPGTPLDAPETPYDPMNFGNIIDKFSLQTRENGVTLGTFVALIRRESR
ncbi:hypothetical protein D9611_012470 [Ephemerocybe angulata]|uniref:Uncharacterized protein n=1 Tax=Ephemerocybe angulata TaxID=980116 RepID=A0A8H5CAN4_9AGAR|nr:hypothetical protein D9611_012470 [Tulosesus angulatus]